MDFYFNAYNQLQYDRPVGMSVGAIPWTSIITWCKLHGICGINEIETVLRYIRAMEKADYDFNERRNKVKDVK